MKKLKTSVVMTLVKVERMKMRKKIPGLTSSLTCKEWAIAWESRRTTWPLSSSLHKGARQNSLSPTPRQKWRRSEGMKTIQISFNSAEQLTPTSKWWWWAAVVKQWVAEVAIHKKSVLLASALILEHLMIVEQFSPSSQQPRIIKCKNAHHRREARATPPVRVAI